jgi:hypothetical protein
MSRDTEIIVLAKDAEDMMASLDTEEFAHGWGGKRFTPIDDGAFYGDGRGSALCYMWIIQFTRQNWSGFLEYLEGLSWPRPESVQVLLRDQDDDCFGLWMIYNGKLKEVHLPGTERKQGLWDTEYLERTDRPS